MRPLRLTMQAFGPYPERTILDFRASINAGLFGIYGQTGSGKSTIFSAMTFALFGIPAKDDQKASSLRSDHAEASVQTEVEFIFDLSGKRYVIVRYPEQSRPKQRGDGETRNAHEAYLFDATGLSIEEITPENRGKSIAEKKVGVVDEAIREALGYGPDEFRRIVLLPQGRFEAFLSAKTNDRLEILRELFDVSIYRDLAEKLKADAASAEQKVREDRNVCAARLTAEGFESSDALVSGIAETYQLLEALQNAENEQRGSVVLAQNAFSAGNATEEKFLAAEKADSNLLELQRGKPSIDNLRTRVSLAESARLLFDVEENVTEADKQVREADGFLKQAQNASQETNERANAAAELLTKEVENAHKVEALAGKINLLDVYGAAVEKADRLKEPLKEATSKVEQAENAYSAEQQKLKKERQKKNELEQKVRKARDEKGRIQDISKELDDARSTLKSAEAYDAANRAFLKARGDRDALADRHAATLAAEQSCHKAYEAAESKLSEVQAFHLAAKLEPGKACPVCGATDHPEPAVGTIAETNITQAFRDAKHAWEEASRETRELETKLSGASAIFEEKQRQLADLTPPSEEADSVKKRVEKLETSLADIGGEVDINALEAEVDELAKSIVLCEEEVESKRDVWITAKSGADNLSTEISAILSDLPKDLLQREAILESKRDLLAERTRLIEARAQAEKEATKAREAALGAEKDREAAIKNLDGLKNQQENAVKQFQHRLQSAGFSSEKYAEIKPSVATIDGDRETISEFEKRLASAEDTLKQAQEAIRDKPRPDIPALADAKRDAEEKLEEAVKLCAKAKLRCEHLEKLREELASILRKLDEAEAESGALRELAALTNGDNAQKLRLEVFAIGAMFDQVLAAANLRFGPMTSSRYRLERDFEEGGRGQRGLGIQVFDNHTGKARSTTTLSGGETFIAALALALGLADIVESVSGKVRLDTIFIDEGFGSLDTESGAGTLDLVLQVLSSLVSQNRSVGLISHVPLVQEAIPNGFYVKKQLVGSIVESRGDI